MTDSKVTFTTRTALLFKLASTYTKYLLNKRLVDCKQSYAKPSINSVQLTLKYGLYVYR